MVLYDQSDDYVDPYGQGGQQVPGTQGQGAQPNCGPGTYETSLDANGNNIPGGWDCVDEAEADRRRNIHYGTGDPRNKQDTTPGKTSGSGGGGGGKAPAYPNLPPVPQFDAPEFEWNETFSAPTFAEAQNEPGYQFRLNSGLGAIQNSAAAKGLLRTGGTFKDLNDYAQNFASQDYGNVYNRKLTDYNTRFGTAKDKFGFKYQGALDEYKPNLLGWQTNSAYLQHLGDMANSNWLTQWLHDNLSAADIFGAGQ